MNDKNNEKILSDKEKLAAILQYLRIKIAEFATKTGSNADHLYNLNSGKINEFSQEVRRNILNTYKEINPQWLLTGEGNMLRSDNSSQQSSVGDNSGIIVQHGGGGDTYNNHSDLMQVVISQQKTIQDLTEQNKMLTQIIASKI